MVSAAELSIPRSSATVRISAMNTLLMGNIAKTVMGEPEVPWLKTLNGLPSWNFLIEHTDETGKQRKVLFDLAMRKDYENSPKWVTGFLDQLKWSIEIDKDVSEVLQEQGQDLESIEAIIWGHFHFDHTGDPKKFPSSTTLIVGPGFKRAFTPGYPENQESPVSTEAWTGRELREIDFEKEGSGFSIGGFEAYDYFGDGSFYLLDVPGHCIGHMCALARTTPDTFVLLGSDTAHYPGNFRPSAQVPLPEQISPHPLTDAKQPACPCEEFTRIHPTGKTNEPFFVPSKAANYDFDVTLQSRDKMQAFDACDDVFVIIAHDASLLGIIDEYPKTLNAWKEKGWKHACKWRFLRDFRDGLEKE